MCINQCLCVFMNTYLFYALCKFHFLEQLYGPLLLVQSFLLIGYIRTEACGALGHKGHFPLMKLK